MAEKAETMKKAEFVALVAEQSAQSKKDVEVVLNSVLDCLVESVASGKKVSFIGFGSFERKTRVARAGRNPKTGESIQIPETKTVGFTASKNFKETINKK